MTGRYAIAATLCFLTGCTVGPDYVRPPDSLAQFHNTTALASPLADQNPVPLDQWWLSFNDPVLAQIVMRALAQNLDLAAAFDRVQQSRALAAQADATLLPSTDATAQASALHQSLESPLGKIASHLPGYNRDQRLYDVGAVASWEIDISGGLRRSSNAASDELAVAQAEHLGSRVSVAADAADAYMQVRGAQAQLAVVLAQIEVNQHLANLVRARRQHETATDREVAQADALVQQAQSNVPPLRFALEAQLNRLDVLMGAQPGTYAKDLSNPREIPAVPALTANVTPADVLRRRPDVIAAERRVAASSERIGAAISGYYPKFSLSGVLAFDGLDINQFASAKSFQPIGTAGLRWRLFDFGRVDAEVAQARGANAEQLALYRLTVLHAAEDVEDAFSALAQTQARTPTLRGEIASLSRARDLSQQSYDAGLIPLTDVLDADRQLLGAQDELVRNQEEAARAAVHTFRAIGGGWS